MTRGDLYRWGLWAVIGIAAVLCVLALIFGCFQKVYRWFLNLRLRLYEAKREELKVQLSSDDMKAKEALNRRVDLEIKRDAIEARANALKKQIEDMSHETVCDTLRRDGF